MWPSISSAGAITFNTTRAGRKEWTTSPNSGVQRAAKIDYQEEPHMPRRILLVMSLALIAGVFVSTSVTPALACNYTPPQGATCNLSTGKTSGGSPCPWFVGGRQTPSNYNTVLYEAKATIGMRNPSPVYTHSAVWVSLQNLDLGVTALAQVGWDHWVSGNGQAQAFVQWVDANGKASPIYYYNNAANPDSYRVDYVSSIYGPAGFAFSWTGYSVSTPSSGYSWWTPYTVATYGEIQDYTYQLPSSQGSQAAGDYNHPVNFTNVNWNDVNGTVHSASLDYGASVTAHADYQTLYQNNGSQWGTWDSRCTN
jgi:hypothetical protein